MAVDIAEVCLAAYEGQQERGLAVWLAILFCVYITLAVGLAIVVRIREAYGTIEADEIRDMDLDVALAQYAEDHPGEANPA